MARTPSIMLPLGTTAPDFTLPNSEGVLHSLQGIRGEHGVLLMFMCNHCPFVKHVAKVLASLGKDCQNRGIGVAAIMPNDIANYPDDAPPRMKEFAKEHAFTFPYLYDESQECAKAYRAACTPDFYLFDTNLKLYYRGQLDSSRPGNGVTVTGEDIRNAVDSLCAAQPAPDTQIPSLGCNIKWKAGNEPEYFRLGL